MSYETEIVRHLARTGYDDLPATTIAATKRSILDTIGVMLAATTLSKDCAAIAALYGDIGGKAESTVLGYGHRLPAAAAAFVNGALTHSLDYDDTHLDASCHPMAETLPAALALAERSGHVSGRELIAATALGGDLVCRIGLSLDLNITGHGWLTSAVLGYFGAAASGGKILGFTADELANALGIAFAQTAGSHQVSKGKGSSVRGIRDGFSQQAGVLSCLLVQSGVTGPAEFLSGESGLFNQYFKGKYTQERLLDRLGEVYEGENVMLKRWPSCRQSHVYIDAALAIAEENALSVEHMDEISITVDDWAKMLCEPAAERARPTSRTSAQYSIPYCVGAALAHDGLGIEHFTAKGLADPASLAAAAKVRYRHEPEAFPGKERPGIVHVRADDGRELSKVVTVPRGSPPNAMAEADLCRKFTDCARYAVSQNVTARIGEIIQMCLSLENVRDIRELTRLLH